MYAKAHTNPRRMACVSTRALDAYRIRLVVHDLTTLRPGRRHTSAGLLQAGQQ